LDLELVLEFGVGVRVGVEVGVAGWELTQVFPIPVF
jgi:hypothetical protein